MCPFLRRCTGAQKHTPSERARGHSPREQGGEGRDRVRRGCSGRRRLRLLECVLRAACRFINSVNRSDCRGRPNTLRGRGANGKGQPSQPASPADLFSQVKSVWQSFWTGGRVDVFYVPFAYTCITLAFSDEAPNPKRRALPLPLPCNLSSIII